MITTAELKDLKVSGSGDKAEGRTYTISVTMSLIYGTKIIFERIFAKGHESPNTIKQTMELIKIEMKGAKTDFEDEQTMKSDAEKEIQSMTDSINGIK